MTPDSLIHKLLLLWLGFFLLCFNTSCGQKNEETNSTNSNASAISVAENEGHFPIGVPIPIEAKKINPNSIEPPKVVSEGQPRMVTVATNISPAGLPKVFSIPEEYSQHLRESDRVIIRSEGIIVPARQPQPVAALTPDMKNNAITNIQYLDASHGMSSGVINAILEDRNGYIWFGTGGGGLSRYDGKFFLHFSEREGLLHSSVLSLLEDIMGNIWIGTDGRGVSKYDGKSFTHFTTNNGLSDDKVNAILEDSEGNLWFATGEGVNKFDPIQQTITYYKDELADNFVCSIFEDSKGDLWFGTHEGLSRFDGHQFINYPSQEKKILERVYTIVEDYSGKLWFGSEGGLTCYDGNQFTHYTTTEGLVHERVYSVAEDKHGNLWLATEGGLSIYDGTNFTNYTIKEGITENSLLALLQDSQGNFWLGSRGGGVNKFDNNRIFQYIEKEDLVNHQIYSLLSDSTGNILIGTRGGLTKYSPGTYQESYAHFRTEQGLIDNFIFSMLEDSHGNLWLATNFGVSCFDGRFFKQFTTREGLSEDTVISILEDSQGNIWLGTDGDGITKFDPNRQERSFVHYTSDEGLAGEIVFDLLEDRQGNIWIATENGLSKYHLEEGQEFFTHYTSKEGLSTDKINTIYEDRQGNIWLGTWNGGLNIFNGDSFTHITTADGLSNNIVQSIIEDSLGNFWVSTEQGLDLLIPNTVRFALPDEAAAKSFQIINLGKVDGFKLLPLGKGLLTKNNRIVWETTILDLNNFQLPTQAPWIQLSHIELDQRFIDFRGLKDDDYIKLLPFGEKLRQAFDSIVPFNNYPLNLKLPYHINHLTFNFSAIDWVAPHKIKYQFMLEGLDNDWNPVSTETKADYRSLSPGTYTFKVKAAGQNILWSDPFQYTFSILPPWWLTWWAKALYILSGGMTIIAYVRYRTARLKKRQKALEQTIRERTAELVEQKERAERSEKYKEQFLANMSHEIRTPMNAISGMIKILKRNEHPRAQDKFLDAIHQSSDNMLVILNDILDLSKIEAGKIQVESIPVNLKKIVENVIEIMRFKAEEKGLQLTYTIADKVSTMIMSDPTRLNQILLNLVGNAIKFTQEGKVAIFVNQNEISNTLKFAIKDSGIGIPADKLDRIFSKFEQADGSTTRTHGGTGLGLSISQQLVALLNGKIWAESVEGRGSTFFFELPYLSADGMEEAKPVISEAQLQEMANALSGIHILLAEDNAFNVMVAQDDLTYFIRDIQIDVAGNGQIALEKFKTGNYDLILMDVQMPELSGLEASNQIRAFEATQGELKNIPIIAMTASLLKEEIQQCYDAGMNHYVPKPYRIEELIGAIYQEASK